MIVVNEKLIKALRVLKNGDLLVKFIDKHYASRPK